MRTPLPFQIAALEYALPKPRIALFMEMRLGKTLVAIRWAEAEEPSSVLVLAPATVLASWHDELRLEGLAKSDIYVRDERAAYAQQDGWHLWNYELARARSQVLSRPWDVLICDESTRIRNPKAQITKLLLKHTQHIPRKAILTGLPAPESSLDYFTQCCFLNRSFLSMSNYWGFRFRYFVTDSRGWDWWPKPGTVQAIKEEVHHIAFVLTRKEAGIGSRKVYERRTVPMVPKQKTAYQKAEHDFELLLDGQDTKLTNNVLTHLLWMSRIAGGFSSEEEKTVYSTEKVKALVELLTGELAHEQVVVWFRFNREIAEVAKALGRPQVFHVVITGDTTLEHRAQKLALFRNKGCRVLLAQVKCAKFGLDCSQASTAIYYSNGFDYEDRAQSEDRIVHPQKSEPLLYIDLITEKTIDQDIVSVLREKGVNSRVFMTRLIKSWRKHA